MGKIIKFPGSGGERPEDQNSDKKESPGGGKEIKEKAGKIIQFRKPSDGADAVNNPALSDSSRDILERTGFGRYYNLTRHLGFLTEFGKIDPRSIDSENIEIRRKN